MITLSYPDRQVRVPKGLSVLEASLRNKIPHASVCGGRARCSTCRIRVVGDRSALPPPSGREAFVLARVGAAIPSIRLACQLRPRLDIAVIPILPPNECATCCATAPHEYRQRTLRRQHVRRHARIDQACGSAAAVRRRVPHQSLPRRVSQAVARRRRCSRTSSSATACSRCSGLRRRRDCVPPGDARCRQSRRQRRQLNQPARSGPARADPVWDRHPRRRVIIGDIGFRSTRVHGARRLRSTSRHVCRT